MKKVFLIALAGMLVRGAFAACEQESKVYTSCKSGYYKNGDTCLRCPPSLDGVYGTTVDKNTGGRTSCYIPSGNSFSDSTGSGTYMGNCYYSE